MRGCGSCSHRAWDLRCERGGGSKPQPPTIIQAPAPTPISPQAVSDTARSSLQAQLEFNPQIQEQAIQSQISGAPRLAQSQFDIQSQYAPQYRQLYEQLFPSQTQGLETLSQQVLQRLGSPMSLTPEQQSAQDAFRTRQRDELSRVIRERANLGGTLYGGRAQEQEMRAQAELANQYALSDIDLQSRNRSQLLQELIAASQPVFPEVQQPGVPQFGTSAAPSGDALLQAMMGQAGNFGVVPGTPGTPGFFGSFVNAFRGR